jgi:hypothetical protein
MRPATVPKSSRILLDLGMKKRIPAKITPENKTFGRPENISALKLCLIKIGIKTSVVIPVSDRETAAPLRPRIGTRIKREKTYWVAAITINIPEILGFPIPINMEERVYPNIRRNVPMIRI